MTATVTAQNQENRILGNLLRDTMAGRIRWGFQPPSTIQTNQGGLHYVLRARKGRAKIYRLTARRDGGKTLSLMIERPEAEADQLTQLFRLVTSGEPATDE